MDKTQPLVSIIIPLYNQERYFNACIRSVRNQTYKNLEIIVVNDGSTDRSPKMAHDWAAKDTRVKVIDKKNEGVSMARRDGFFASTGEYIMFLDSDDRLIHQSVELLMNVVVKHRVDLVIGMYDYIIGRITTHYKVDRAGLCPCGRVISQPELFDDYYVNFFASSKMFPVNVWGRIFRKSVIDKAYDETDLFSPDISFMGEDLYFNMKLFPYLSSIYRINKSVYKYRHGGGTFGFNKNFPQIFLLFEKRLELLDKYNYTQGYEPMFKEYMLFVYHHASQLIYFEKAEKQDVIAFMRQELETRAMFSRLLAFFAGKEVSKDVDMILKQDYDGMYDYAKVRGRSTFGTLEYKVIRLLVNFFG